MTSAKTPGVLLDKQFAVGCDLAVGEQDLARNARAIQLARKSTPSDKNDRPKDSG